MSPVGLSHESVIAVVDFGPFLDGSNRQGVADAMFNSFKDKGFVYLVNHGLSEEKIEGMFQWSKRFFSQSMEAKNLAPHPPSGTHHRGYSAPGIEKVVQHVYDSEELAQNRAKASDVKESFECGREDYKDMPNIWLPDGVLPGFKEACLDFFWACHELQLVVLRALALGFKLPEEFFLPYHKDSDNQLRLLHYPSVPIDALENDAIARIGAHSDFGSITLLLQDSAGGLEVEDPKQPGHFIGRSNDIIPSAIHRVRLPPGLKTKDGMAPERYSIPYFCSADMSTVVDCLPGTYSDERPKRYDPLSAEQYIMKRLAANY